MRSLPACGMKVTGVQAVCVEHIIKRQQDVLFRKLADPREINGDDVISARFTLCVAKHLFVQAINRKCSLIDFNPDNLFKLTL